MRITAWRLVANRWASSAFSGEGARLAGGRWNSKGVPLVYLGGSLALAALELLVHIDHASALAQHQAIPVDFPDSFVLAVDPSDLPNGFPAPDTIEATRRIGDAWTREAPSVLLRVPSAVVPAEFNYLFNPAHPTAKEVRVGISVPFSFDRRLIDRPSPQKGT